MLVDMHAHVIPGALRPCGTREGHLGPRVGPCDDPHARLLESDRMQFKASDAFYSAERRLEEQERSGVDAEVVSPMPPLLDYSLPADEGLELCRRVNAFIAELTRTDPNRLLGMGMVPMQAPGARLRRARARAAMPGWWRSRSPPTSWAAPCTRTSSPSSGPRSSASRCRCSSTGCPATWAGACRRGWWPSPGSRSAPTARWRRRRSSPAAWPRRHPGLRLAFSHGAGGFPCMLPRANFFWGKTWNEEPSSEGEGISPAELARRFYYDGLVMDHRTLRAPHRDDGPPPGSRRAPTSRRWRASSRARGRCARLT